jgi:hypothetical protein
MGCDAICLGGRCILDDGHEGAHSLYEGPSTEAQATEDAPPLTIIAVDMRRKTITLGCPHD